MSTISSTAAGEARFCLCSRREPLPDGYRGLYFPDTADACRKRYEREQEQARREKAELDHNEQVLARKQRRDRLYGQPRADAPKRAKAILSEIEGVLEARRDAWAAGEPLDHAAVEDRLRGLWLRHYIAKCNSRVGVAGVADPALEEPKRPAIRRRRRKPVPLKVTDMKTGEVKDFASFAAYKRDRLKRAA